jgi:hypothetical protein
MKSKLVGGLIVVMMFSGAIFATPPKRVVQKQQFIAAPQQNFAKIEKRFVEYNPYNPYYVGLPVDSLGLGYYYSVGDQAKIKALEARIDEQDERIANLEGALSDLLDKLEGKTGGGDGGKSDGGGDLGGPDEQLEAKLLAHRTHIKELLSTKYNCKKCHNQDRKSGGFQIFDGENVVVWEDELAMRKIHDQMESGDMPKRPETQPPPTKGDVDYIKEYNKLKWGS